MTENQTFKGCATSAYLNEVFREIFGKATATALIIEQSEAGIPIPENIRLKSFQDVISIAASKDIWLYNHPAVIADLGNLVYENAKARDIIHNLYVQLRYRYGGDDFNSIVTGHISKVAFEDSAYVFSSEENSPVPVGMKEQLKQSMGSKNFSSCLTNLPWLVVLLLIGLNTYDIVMDLNNTINAIDAQRKERANRIR